MRTKGKVPVPRFEGWFDAVSMQKSKAQDSIRRVRTFVTENASALQQTGKTPGGVDPPFSPSTMYIVLIQE
ncbi:hypothetical protein CTA1_844 [Colletotrichum tanaceti]|uniref:Uncharacterized protein n=1 Tax=Colletotrichum tanaceti TaxID=1306861 RepID=A0A4U6X6C1_9PEZI|nr:hypothetical protein CTA1_844 [Colletotrichum tanaceti]